MEKKTGLIHFVPEWKCVDDQPDNNRRLHYSRFALSPLFVDQAMTIGVAIRRALLSEVEGLSIISANIVGAIHEYSTLYGVRESVDEILLNLKQIVLKSTEDASLNSSSGVGKGNQKEYRASIFAQGPGVVTAEHIKFPSSILAVDPDQPIATLLNDTQLCIEVFIKQGISKQLNRNKKNYPGFFIDGNFTPVQKANFSIHSVGDPKGLQQLLLLEIWTNKTLTPAEALYQAHASLLDLFHKISPPQAPSKKKCPPIIALSEQRAQGGSVWDEGSIAKKIDSLPLSTKETIQDAGKEVGRLMSIETRKDSIQTSRTPTGSPERGGSREGQNSIFPKDSVGSLVRLNSSNETNFLMDKQSNDTFNQETLSIDELELSPRISNCLKRANIHTIADLVRYTEEDLLQIKNFGRKSVDQVSLVLRKRFNMEFLTKK
jgi:DNA-directed RNA polymerase alpha subunit